MIEKLLNDYIERKNIKMEMKRLIFDMIYSEKIDFDKLIQNNKYMVWKNCNKYESIKKIGIDEILKIEIRKDEFNSHSYNDYTIFGKKGVLNFCFFTNVDVLDKIKYCFENRDYNVKIANEIIDYLNKSNIMKLI